MNEKIEQRLRALPLREPSGELDPRVLAAIEGAPKRRHWLATSIAALSAAAAIVLAAVVFWPGPAGEPVAQGPARPPQMPASAPLPELPLQPGTYEHIRTDVNIEKVYMLGPEPFRAFRRRSLRRVWQVDGSGGVAGQRVVPSEEVILIPADLQ